MWGRLEKVCRKVNPIRGGLCTLITLQDSKPETSQVMFVWSPGRVIVESQFTFPNFIFLGFKTSKRTPTSQSVYEEHVKPCADPFLFLFASPWLMSPLSSSRRADCFPPPSWVGQGVTIQFPGLHSQICSSANLMVIRVPGADVP